MNAPRVELTISLELASTTVSALSDAVLLATLSLPQSPLLLLTLNVSSC